GAEVQWVRQVPVMMVALPIAGWGSIRGPLTLHVHYDRLPPPLPEARDAEDAADRVPQQDRDPDIDRVEPHRLLDDEAETKLHHHLRDDRDVERALRVAGSLKPAGVGEGDGDEESRQAQDAQQLSTDLDHRRFGHAEEAEQRLGHEQEQGADGRRTAN